MERIYVKGGHRLKGDVQIGGMKNSILPVIFSCLLISGDCIIDNAPRVSDVENALSILRSMGAKAEFCDTHTILINTENAIPRVEDIDLVGKMRASSYLMGAMLSRFGEVVIPMPGGCNFGARPIDLHLKGFSSLGAECIEKNGKIHIKANKKQKCNKIILDKISVGATINMVLASVLRDGTTIIENVAKEPHVKDLIIFLNMCGARIKHCESFIACKGVKRLYGTRFKVYPDMIEALTYITFAGICKGKLNLLGVNNDHIENELKLFSQMGFKLKKYTNHLTVSVKKLVGADVVTAPYPFFPTDLHPQFSALLCYTKNGGTIREGVFPTRFAYADELVKMGARIEREGEAIRILPSALKGAELDATDLRAGACLVGASLGAEGESTINNVNYIVRGYENIVGKISSIGGKIKLVKGE